MSVTPPTPDVNRSLLTAVALALLLLAGCSGVGDSGDAGPAGTVTPVPVTDAENVDRVTIDTITPERVGTPIPRDGGEFESLLDDHEQALSDTAYAYRVRIRGTDEGRPDGVFNTTAEVFRGENETVYYVRETSGRDRELRWSNGSVAVSLREFGNRTVERVDRTVSAGQGEAYVGSIERMRTLFTFARPTDITSNETHYRIEGVLRPRDGQSLIGEEGAIENSSITMTVDDTGVIESYRFEFVGYRRGAERIEATERFSLDRSAGALPRPDWVDRVIENETAG